MNLDALDFSKSGGVVTVVCQDALSGAVLMVAYANREALELTQSSGEMHYWSRTRGLWRKGASSGSVQRVVELRYDCDADAILARVDAVLPACHTGSPSCFGELAESAGILDRLDGVIGSRARRTTQEQNRSVDIERGQAGPRTAADIEKAQPGLPTAGGIEKAQPGPPTAGDIEKAQPGPPTAGDNPESLRSPHPNDASDTAVPRPSYTRRLLDDRNLRLKKIGEEAAELVTACADADAGRACEEAADLLYHVLVAVRAAGGSLREVQAVLARRHAR